METYRFGVSNYESDKHIAELNRRIRDRYADKPFQQELIAMLLRNTDYAATRNVGTEGGPFGAMLVDLKTEDGIPKVVGYGTNHVVPTSDPSAHAEVTAIRDTARRLGRTNLSGLTLVTSCECCPMCLSAATGCNVDDIYFAATREQAARIGFSDADQYRLMSAGGIEQHAKKTSDTDAIHILDGHDAVVEVKHEGKTYVYYGDYNDPAAKDDPTALPVVQAIRKACAGHAKVTGEQFVFHLPADTRIISVDKPHPLSLVAADWARIGRERGADPKDPEQDKKDKNKNLILYLEDTFEHMPVRDAHGKTTEVEAEKVWETVQSPTAKHVQIPETAEKLSHAHKKWGDFIADLSAGKSDGPSTVRKY